MHMDSSSTAWVCGLRALTTPPNLAFIEEKTLFHVVPDAQYVVERAGVLVAEPQHLGLGA